MNPPDPSTAPVIASRFLLQAVCLESGEIIAEVTFDEEPIPSRYKLDLSNLSEFLFACGEKFAAKSSSRVNAPGLPANVGLVGPLSQKYNVSGDDDGA